MNREEYLREKYRWTGDQIEMVSPLRGDDQEITAAQRQNPGQVPAQEKQRPTPD